MSNRAPDATGQLMDSTIIESNQSFSNSFHISYKTSFRRRSIHILHPYTPYYLMFYQRFSDICLENTQESLAKFTLCDSFSM